MAPKLSEQDRETSQYLLELMEGAIDELAEILPEIDFSKPVSDEKIRKALLELTPEGYERLVQQYGRETVVKFISDFTANRRM